MAKDKKTGKPEGKTEAKSQAKPEAKSQANPPQKAKAKKGQAKPEAKPDAKAAQQPAADVQVPKDYVPRLKKYYEDVVRKSLIEQFGYKNPMEVPRLEKIVLNMGVGEAVGDGKIINVAADELAKIAGQKPIITKSRKSIATFKIRENQ